MQFLSQCVVGASLEEIEDEEQPEEEEEEEKEEAPKIGVYEIIGTVKDPSKPEPSFVKEIVKVCSVLSVLPASSSIVTTFLI